MSARTEVAAALAAALPAAWIIRLSENVPDGIETGTYQVMVSAGAVRPGASLGLRQWTVVIDLMTAKQDEPDDDLEAGLAVLLDTLDTLPVLAWTEAERVTISETFPAYRITLTTQHRKG